MRGLPRRLAISFFCWSAFLEDSRLGSSWRRPAKRTRQLSAALAAYSTSSCTNRDEESVDLIAAAVCRSPTPLWPSLLAEEGKGGGARCVGRGLDSFVEEGDGEDGRDKGLGF